MVQQIFKEAQEKRRLLLNGTIYWIEVPYMKITKTKLMQIVQEEIAAVLEVDAKLKEVVGGKSRYSTGGGAHAQEYPPEFYEPDPEEKLPAKLKTGTLTKGAQAQALRQKAKSVQAGEVGGETTNLERSLVKQASDVLADIADDEGVNLGQHRSTLNTLLNKLKQITGAD